VIRLRRLDPAAYTATVRPGQASVVMHEGVRLASPASTWAMLGRLEVFDLVALGDFFVREWRAVGCFRVNVGMRPFTRCHLVTAGLPEPVLNRDYFDGYGEHLGCIDLSYPAYRVAIEYQGRGHANRYARDIERTERLRAEGWIVIQVTSALLRDPASCAGYAPR
jgi:hypothetical protein